ASPERLPQLGERLQAERLGEILVDHDRAGRIDRFYSHIEFRILAGELRTVVVAREGDRHQPGLAHRHTDDLIFEARDEGPGPDIDADILPAAALERGS